MTKELIERYIQFAIENGYKGLPKRTKIKEFRFFIDEKEIFETGSLNTLSITDIITSGPFIEAIIKGTFKILGNRMKDEFTAHQAIAIRDNKLDELIQTLLPKE